MHHVSHKIYFNGNNLITRRGTFFFLRKEKRIFCIFVL